MSAAGLWLDERATHLLRLRRINSASCNGVLWAEFSIVVTAHDRCFQVRGARHPYNHIFLHQIFNARAQQLRSSVAWDRSWPTKTCVTGYLRFIALGN